MPFTGAHPAAVLPLARTGLPLSALVIGSMAPDVPLFVPPLRAGYALTHSAVGVMTVDLVLGLAVVVVWHGVLAPVGAGALPRAARARLGPGRPASLGHVLGDAVTASRVALALVVGAVTHVVWDLFTHEGRWGVRVVQVLASDIGPWPAYRWAQYLSGVLGVVVLAVAVARWWRRAGAGPAGQEFPALPVAWAGAFWAALLLAGVAGATLRVAALAPGAVPGRETVLHYAFAVVTGATAGAVACAVCLALLARASRLPAGASGPHASGISRP